MEILEKFIVRTADVLDVNMGEEKVLMSIDQGNYYCLTDTSRVTWDLIKEPILGDALFKILADKYDAPVEQIQLDTSDFINFLVSQNLAIVK